LFSFQYEFTGIGDGDGDSTEMMFSLEENRDQPPLSGNDVTNPTGRFPLGTSPLLRGSPPASSVGSGSLPSVLVVGASPPSVSDGNQSCNEREGSGGGGGVAVRHPHTRQTKLMAQLLKQPVKYTAVPHPTHKTLCVTHLHTHKYTISPLTAACYVVSLFDLNADLVIDVE